MSEQTYHMTEADVQKSESRTSKAHGGDIPAGSEAAMMQSIVDKHSRDKQDIIAERQANLPLPEDPPGTSDFNSADQRTVNVGSGEEPTGGFSYGADSLREPATGGSVARERGDELKKNVLGQGVGREVCAVFTS